jgi:hypothetical protein
LVLLNFRSTELVAHLDQDKHFCYNEDAERYDRARDSEKEFSGELGKLCNRKTTRRTARQGQAPWVFDDRKSECDEIIFHLYRREHIDAPKCSSALVSKRLAADTTLPILLKVAPVLPATKVVLCPFAMMGSCGNGPRLATPQGQQQDKTAREKQEPSERDATNVVHMGISFLSEYVQRHLVERFATGAVPDTALVGSQNHPGGLRNCMLDEDLLFQATQEAQTNETAPL